MLINAAFPWQIRVASRFAAEHAARYGAELPVRDWVKRLKCSRCGSRSVDFVLTGVRR